MTPFHIEHSSRKAATICCRVLERVTVPWLVWSVSDEGYMMAPVFSSEAIRIKRYYPECIAGEYKRPQKLKIMADMIEAKERQAIQVFTRTEERKEYERQYKANRRAMGLCA